MKIYPTENCDFDVQQQGCNQETLEIHFPSTCFCLEIHGHVCKISAHTKDLDQESAHPLVTLASWRCRDLFFSRKGHGLTRKFVNGLYHMSMAIFRGKIMSFIGGLSLSWNDDDEPLV